MRRHGLITMVLLLLLIGCSEHSNLEVANGQVLSPEEQRSLYEERLEQQSEQDVSVKGIVYWTSSGTKYHKDPQCSYLKKAKKVLSGTVAQAANYGAKHPCSGCAGG